jgi:hypothetical protein
MRANKNAADTSAVLGSRDYSRLLEVSVGENGGAVRPLNSAPLQGPGQRPLPAALSGSLNKAPGFAGGYLPQSAKHVTIAAGIKSLVVGSILLLFPDAQAVGEVSPRGAYQTAIQLEVPTYRGLQPDMSIWSEARPTNQLRAAKAICVSSSVAQPKPRACLAKSGTQYAMGPDPCWHFDVARVQEFGNASSGLIRSPRTRSLSRSVAQVARSTLGFRSALGRSLPEAAASACFDSVWRSRCKAKFPADD